MLNKSIIIIIIIIIIITKLCYGVTAPPVKTITN